jgi:hypothetical protein
MRNWWVITNIAAAGLGLILILEIIQLFTLVITGQATWGTLTLTWFRRSFIGGQIIIDLLILIALLFAKLGIRPSHEDILFPEISQMAIIGLFVLIFIRLYPLLFLGVQRIQ